MLSLNREYTGAFQNQRNCDDFSNQHNCTSVPNRPFWQKSGHIESGAKVGRMAIRGNEEKCKYFLCYDRYRTH